MKEKTNCWRFDILLFLLLFAQVASLGILNGLVIFSRPFAAYIRYIVFFLAYINLGIYVLEGKQNSLVAVWFFISFLITGIIGYIHTKDIMNVLIEASHYVTIISIYFWVERHHYTVENIVKYIYIIIPILLTTSILSSFGYLHGMKDSSGGLLRNSVDVDGTIGVVATLTVFHMINQRSKVGILDYIEFIMGILVVSFSISRGRIAILFICIFIYMLTTLKYGTWSKMKRIIPIITLIVLLFIAFANITGGLVEQIISRFQTTTENDINVTNRSREIAQHIEILQSNVLFGDGWGMLSRHKIHDHCSYSAVLAFMGLIGGIPFLLWFAYYLIKSLDKVLTTRNIDNNHLSFIVLFAIMALAVTNMAFNKTGGVWGALIAYVAILDTKQDEKDGKKIQREYKYII